jgi:hypothetical protein
MIDQMPIRMPSTMNAFITPGSEARIPSMISLRDGILLNNRNTRKARKSRRTEMPGKSESTSDMSDIRTMIKSNLAR